MIKLLPPGKTSQSFLSPQIRVKLLYRPVSRCFWCLLWCHLLSLIQAAPGASFHPRNLKGKRTHMVKRHLSSLHANKCSIFRSRIVLSPWFRECRSSSLRPFSRFSGQGPYFSYSYSCGQKKSAVKDLVSASQLFKKGVIKKKGILIGPFQSSPFSVFPTSPTGCSHKNIQGRKD